MAWTWTGSHGDTDSYVCKSTDEKETAGIRNGSDVLEIDTGKVLFFDIETEQWINPFGGG